MHFYEELVALVFASLFYFDYGFGVNNVLMNSVKNHNMNKLVMILLISNIHIYTYEKGEHDPTIKLVLMVIHWIWKHYILAYN